ncbi:MAG: YegP family protein [Acidimicrobiales bacterium]|nr:YegP family protein [Acidimicrobiales bacterium]
MAGKFEIKAGARKSFRFNLKAGNGQVILTSESYKTKKACENGVASVKKNCSNDNCFDRKIAKNNKPYFNLKSTNGQVIGKSQMYASNASMENGIASVKKNAPGAAVVDLTA